MCDAAIGGKTGVDLPQGKNLIGAFHSPQIVLSDPAALKTLPEREVRSGLAEVVKAGVIDDPILFHLCAGGWDTLASRWAEVISRATAVKVRVIEIDPFEKGERAVLNLGHTIGHAVEWASRESLPGGDHFRLSHGEAVAIGMVVEAYLAEELGLAQKGLAQQIQSVLHGLGLPTDIPPGYTAESLIAGMKVDKKRLHRQIRFALPVKVGQVKYGIGIEEEQICKLISSCMART
jgi:3-dehydroquinate synthetase